MKNIDTTLRFIEMFNLSEHCMQNHCLSIREHYLQHNSRIDCHIKSHHKSHHHYVYVKHKGRPTKKYLNGLIQLN